jgi:peptidoglycan/xylan/chitin deacetylase (PgdA/CDA1 family)
LILGYHRVADASGDPWGMIVSPARFAEHLEVLREYARPLGLEALAAALRAGQLPSAGVALTFDDGYVDLSQHARPLLERFEVPATVFVIAGELGRTPWWDRLADTVLGGALPPDLELEIGGQPLRWSAGHGTPRTLLDALYRRVSGGKPAAREALLAELAQRLGGTPPGPLARLMDADEVRTLADGGIVRIGAHTLTHPHLGSLDEDSQRREIGGSRERLEKLVGGSVTAFSYPHGSTSATTAGLVREAGFDSACSSVNDVARRGTDPYFLPRFWIGDWDGDTFRRWLVRWL